MDTIESNKKQVSPTISKISMFISAASMGCVGLFVTILAGYTVYTIVLLRGLFGTLFLTLFMLKSRSFNKEFLKESFRLHWKALLIMGIVNPLIIYFYFINITISGYSTAAFLLYTGPIFFLLFLVITKEEKVSKINLISFILAITGVAIIMEFWTGATNPIGILFGILSGLTLGLLVFYKKKTYNVRNKVPTNKKEKGDFDTFLAWWPTLFIVFLFLPIGAADLVKLTYFDLVINLILGFFPTALAFMLYNIGVKNDKGGNIVIISYFEPIMATILMVIIFGTLSIFTIIGGSLILTANMIVLKYSNNK